MRDAYYQRYHKLADDLHFRFQDVRDAPNHPSSQFLTRQFEELKADIASGKDPRAIENRARGIQRQIMQAERQNQRIMSTDHSNYFHERLEHFISDDLRRHPHYN